MDWEIHPNQGLGPLKLGMTEREVAAILDPMGPVEARHKAFDGSVNEFRAMTLPICNYLDGKLAQIDATASIPNVTFRGRNVFDDDPKTVVQEFASTNNGAEADLGAVLFRHLDVYLQGFYDPKTKVFVPKDEDQDDRRAAVFAKGRLDALLPEFKPIDIAN